MVPILFQYHKKEEFELSEKCRQDLQDIKEFLTNPLLLSKLEDREQLFLYLAFLNLAI